MQGTMLYGPRDIRFEAREIPSIEKPTDAVIRMAATCVCGSDLWVSLPKTRFGRGGPHRSGTSL